MYLYQTIPPFSKHSSVYNGLNQSILKPPGRMFITDRHNTHHSGHPNIPARVSIGSDRADVCLMYDLRLEIWIVVSYAVTSHFVYASTNYAASWPRRVHNLVNIQGVPLATKPGISLIILTQVTILQRNLNRSTFVVWEMKKNVSVVNPLIQRRLVFGVGCPGGA